MQIQISWLLQKPTDLDLHCLQRQGISGFSRTRVNKLSYIMWMKFPLLVAVNVPKFCTPKSLIKCHMETVQTQIRLQSNQDVQFAITLSILTHCILNRLSHTIYWKSPISILGMSGYKIYIFLEKNG